MRDRLIELLKECVLLDVPPEYQTNIDYIADHLLENGVIVPPEYYAKIVRCSECEKLKIIGTKEKYARCEKYGFDFLPFEADTRGHFCIHYK